MRNPNGYGGISFMGKNRRNPYRVRITTGWDYDPKTEKTKQKYTTLGYYPSRREAMLALAEFNRDPYDLDAEKLTFKEAFLAWSKKDFEERNYSSRKQYEAAYNKCAPLYNMRMKDIRKKHMQDILDKYANESSTSQQNIKSICKHTFKYCLENDVVTKDYSAFLTVKANRSNSIHKPYTAEEIRLLWDNLKTPVKLRHSKHDFRDYFPADLLLMLIYTGMRPGELLIMESQNVNLEERYMVGGFKTPAGTNRIIPIHKDIYPLIEERMAAGNKYLIPYKTERPQTYNQFRERLHDPFLDILGLTHLPHDGRHTFATFAERYNVNKLSVKMVMGHASNDITDAVYTHKDPAELVEAVDQIVFLKK